MVYTSYRKIVTILRNSEQINTSEISSNLQRKLLMANKIKSTHDEFIESMTPKEKKEYERGFKDFVISELILAAMEEDNISVRKLAKLAGVSPTIVQEMRSGAKKSFNIGSFFSILQSLGYNFLLEKNGKITRLELPHLKKNKLRTEINDEC